jgi:F5/8 type C domain/NPCBM-associated, NEW3 domain of alpha-galactosidase
MRHRVRTAALTSLVLLASLLPVAVATNTASAAPGGYSVLSDSQKRALVLTILEKFVPHAESYWRDSDISQPNTGRYLATGDGVTQPRGAGDIAYAYATLLAAKPDQASFGGVSRAVMLDHTIRSIRHTAYTNKLSGAGHNRWGGGTWQASLETYLWGYAAYLLWDRLDEDTRTLVRRVVEGEAEILVTKPIATATDGNTGAEDNAWNAPTPALAAALSPASPRAATWRRTAMKLALNASSMPGDAQSTQVVDGTPLREWMSSVNLNSDLTMENHGFFNPVYQQVAPLLVGDAAIIEARAGRPLPAAYSFRVTEVWERLLGPLAADDGDIVMPAGQDWISKDYQHLDYLAILATRFGRADASVLESRALTAVATRQATHANGSILGQPQLGYESMLIRRLAGSWWNHTLFGPSPAPSESEFAAARAQTAGVHRFPQSGLVQGRFTRASAFMSWDGARPMGLVVPGAGDDNPDDASFTYYAPFSLIGSASGSGTHTCDCQPDRFSTAGTIGARQFSMTAFPDGVTLLLDRGTGNTFTYSMERVRGVSENRPVYSAGGTGLGELTGNWVNLAGRIGMIVAGGSGISARETTGTNNTTLVTGSTATGSGNRGAILLPLVDHATTARLAATVRQPATPAGWSALLATAHDGTGRLAVARWAGAGSTELSLTDPAGAPILREETRVHGGTGTARVALPAPASAGQTIRFFVSSDGPLVARQDGEDRAVLTNPGTAAVRATVRYVSDGNSQTDVRVIWPGETVTVRIVGGRLTTAGPEHEAIASGRTTVNGLLADIVSWRDAGQIGAGAAGRLTGTARLAGQALDRAAVAVELEQPDTREAVLALEDAARAAERLLPAVDVPSGIRAALGAAQERIQADLTAARGHLRVTVTAWAGGAATPGEEMPMLVAVHNRSGATIQQGQLSVRVPSGWTVPGPVDLGSIQPGRFAVATAAIRIPATASPGATAGLTAVVAYRSQEQTTSQSADLRVSVQPLLTVASAEPALPLAARGWNRTVLTVANNANRPLAVALTNQAPTGTTARPARSDVTVPARGSAQVTVELTNESQTTGTGRLAIVAATTGGMSATAGVDLLYSDNLARNPVGAALPAAFADSHQATFPERLATDGDPATFWVAAGSAAGDGPTAARPIAVGVDTGRAVQIGSVTMRPRVGYGPRTYEVQVSDDGQTWGTVVSVPSAANTVTTTSFPPVTARYVRLRITDSWDPIRPPRNVQLAELEVRP